MFHFFQQIFLHSIFTIFYLLKLWSLECRLVLVFCVVLKLLLTILKCCKVKWSEVKWKWQTAKYGDPYSEFVL